MWGGSSTHTHSYTHAHTCTHTKADRHSFVCVEAYSRGGGRSAVTPDPEKYISPQICTTDAKYFSLLILAPIGRHTRTHTRTHKHTHTHTHKHTERDRQRNRQTDTQTHIHAHRHTDRYTDRYTDRPAGSLELPSQPRPLDPGSAPTCRVGQIHVFSGSGCLRPPRLDPGSAPAPAWLWSTLRWCSRQLET